jgi:NADH-quinone oxidoreductase subunit J
MWPQHVAFAIVAAAMVIAAVRMVTTKNIVHAALYLVVVLAGVAAQYILVAAEFLGWVQVLVYIGAIVVLFLFGIMLTRAPMGDVAGLDNDQRWPALIVGLFLAGVLGTILVDGFDDTRVEPDVATGTTSALATSVFRDYVIPFEIVSMLLLAGLIGAIVMARRD